MLKTGEPHLVRGFGRGCDRVIENDQAGLALVVLAYADLDRVARASLSGQPWVQHTIGVDRTDSA
ncbi:MAG: hypothetical protein ACYCS1_10495 [Gammaproteobacteria bacterium]